MPISTNSVDNVLLLDVLEHLSKPEACIREIERILKPGGRLTIQVPFMYPIHDAPLDFHRWTIHGLRELAERTRFVVREEIAFGNPVESAALLANIAISKTVLNWLRKKNPFALLLVLLPIAIFLINVLAWAMAKITPKDDFMPSGYRMLWYKE
jgi:SAM-dependent methyltransferase